MRKVLGLGVFVFLTFLAQPALASPTLERNPRAFEHGIALEIDPLLF